VYPVHAQPAAGIVAHVERQCFRGLRVTEMQFFRIYGHVLFTEGRMRDVFEKIGVTVFVFRLAERRPEVRERIHRRFCVGKCVHVDVNRALERY